MKANIAFATIIATAWPTSVIQKGSNVHFKTDSNKIETIKNHNEKYFRKMINRRQEFKIQQNQNTYAFLTLRFLKQTFSSYKQGDDLSTCLCFCLRYLCYHHLTFQFQLWDYPLDLPDYSFQKLTSLEIIDYTF